MYKLVTGLMAEGHEKGIIYRNWTNWWSMHFFLWSYEKVSYWRKGKWIIIWWCLSCKVSEPAFYWPAFDTRFWGIAVAAAAFNWYWQKIEPELSRVWRDIVERGGMFCNEKGPFHICLHTKCRAIEWWAISKEEFQIKILTVGWLSKWVFGNWAEMKCDSKKYWCVFNDVLTIHN